MATSENDFDTPGLRYGNLKLNMREIILFLFLVKSVNVNFNMIVELDTLLPAVVKEILLKESGPNINKYLLF